jgi:hypothetical protein
MHEEDAVIWGMLIAFYVLLVIMIVKVVEAIVPHAG